MYDLIRLMHLPLAWLFIACKLTNNLPSEAPQGQSAPYPNPALGL